MIDIENKVITIINTALESSGATVSSVFVPEPSKFPWVFVEQSSNSTYQPSLDGSLQEHHARVAFTIVVYSNTSKADAKSIAQTIDETMQNIKFTRTDYGYYDEDRTIHRIVLRYTGIVEAGKTVGNDTIYQIYR